MLLFVIPYIYILPCFSLIFTDFLCFFPLLRAWNLRTGNKHNKIKKKKRGFLWSDWYWFNPVRCVTCHRWVTIGDFCIGKTTLGELEQR